MIATTIASMMASMMAMMAMMENGKWKMEMISLDRWRTRKTTLLGNTSNLRDSRRGPTCSAVQYLVDEKLYLTNLS